MKIFYQTQLAFELLIHIVARADLNEMQMATLAVNLWKLSKKNKTMDPLIEVNQKHSFLSINIFNV